MEYKGFWFLPEEKNNKVAGILTINPFHDNKLELIGGFEKDFKDIISSSKKDVIYGEVYNDESNFRRVTLIDCSYSFNINFSAEHPITLYNCAVVIDGFHILNLDCNSCISITADLTSLYNWKNTGLIKRTWHFPENSQSTSKPEGLSINIDSNDYWEIPVKFDGSITLILFADSNCNTTPDYKETNIKQFTRVKIEAKNEASITALYKYLHLFKQFLSFATLIPIYINKLWLYSSNYYDELSNGDKLELPAFVYIKSFDNDGIRIESKSYNHLFNFSDIEKEFPDVIRKWYDISDDLAPIRNHLIESLRPIKTFSSVNFLIIIQALEGFHRKFRDTEWRKLRVRLKNLIDEFNNIEEVKKITENDIKQAVASRDYYSHFLIGKEDVLEGIGLFELTRKMKYLLICCVLNLVGFKNVKINELLRKNQQTI